MVFNFMSDGYVHISISFITFDIDDSIPIVYYGQEQYSNGNADPVTLFP